MQSNSLTFSLYDPDGAQGFPGNTKGSVKYTLENQSKWSITMQASPDQQTPIMLSSHVYVSQSFHGPDETKSSLVHCSGI